MAWLPYVLIAFIAGIAAGYFLSLYRNNDNRVRELETHLTSLQDKYEQYQQGVTQHFAHTAQLVNNLTNAYREVHEHLQQGAKDLCADHQRHTTANPANSFIDLTAPKESYPHPTMLNDDKLLASMMPPLDYAAKKPNDKGTLDEDFGFK